jgi:hypothetical protein
MANVTIDIPGIGNIEAKNAATESTLRELVNAIKGLQKTTAKGGAGGAAGGGAAGGGSTASAPAKAAASLAGKLGSAAKAVTGFAGAAIGAIQAVGEFAGALSAMIGDIANVGDSIQSAANQIPLLGSFFAPIAGAIEKSVGAFQNASASGATFGGSVNNMARAASSAGMTLDKFAGLISRNGEAMRLLGGSTEDGANRFAQLSKQMRTGGYMASLNNLGYTTEDVNEGMAGYLKFIGQTGKIGGKSNAELAAGSAKYLKEMDLLAKVTGESRKEQEAARAKLLNDAQFQAKVSSMSAEAGEAFANTINGLPPGLRDVAKDIMVTGTATTEEAQKFTALMPKSAALMQKYAAITEAGGTVTAKMQQELQNTMAAEGKEKKLQFKTQGMYNKEMAGTYVQITNAANIQTDGIKKATAAQEESKKTTDALAAASEASKRRLSELSNSFTMMLANSGMLDSLMSAFEMFAKFIQTFVFPIFKVFGDILRPIITVLSAILMPAFKVFGYVMQVALAPLKLLGFALDVAVKGFYTIKDTIEDVFRPPMMMISRIVESVSSFLRNNFLAAIKDVSDFFRDIFKPVLDVVTPIFSAVAKKFNEISTAVGDFFRGFNTLGDIVQWIGLKFTQLGLNIREMWMGIRDFLPFLEDPSDEEKKALEEEKIAFAKEQLVFDERHEKRAGENLKKQKAEESRIAKEREARDKKFYSDKTARDTAATEPKGLDMSSPEATAVSFFTQQKSPLVKAEATKKELENKKDEEAKKIALNPQAVAAEQAAAATKTSSPELAEISKSMAELVKINKSNTRIMERQLNVQESFSGDVWAYPAA